MDLIGRGGERERRGQECVPSVTRGKLNDGLTKKERKKLPKDETFAKKGRKEESGKALLLPTSSSPFLPP